MRVPDPALPELSALVGSWRLVSVGMTFRDTGERIEPFGPDPSGRMLLEPGGRVMFIFTKSGRQPPANDADRALLFTESMAYSGQVRLEAPGRMVTRIDISINPAWAGEQVRLFRLEGDRLIIATLEQTAPRFPGRVFVGDAVFERESSRRADTAVEC